VQLIYLYVSIMQKIDRHLTCMHTYIYLYWTLKKYFPMRKQYNDHFWTLFLFSVDNMRDNNIIKQIRQEIPPLMDNLFHNVILLDKRKCLFFFQIVSLEICDLINTPAKGMFSIKKRGFCSFVLIDNKQMIRLFSVCWQKLTLKSTLIFTRRDSIVKIYTGQLTT
jgi:hypothetical protein